MQNGTAFQNNEFWGTYLSYAATALVLYPVSRTYNREERLIARVEQPTACKMHVLCGARVMKALLVLNKHSAVAHEVGGHRTPP